LPEAVEMAKAAVRNFQTSGLNVEIRVDVASVVNLQREARRWCDLLLYYGHGSEDGRLAFVDGPQTFAQLTAPLSLGAFWQQLPVCCIFACYGDRFAAALPCPWIAFATPILRHAPRGFLHALLQGLAQRNLREAVEEARAHAEHAMQSPFAEALRVSNVPLPALQIPPGTAVLSRLSPALAGHAEVDFHSVQIGPLSYPDHDPFVGRLEDLRCLWQLPSPYADRALQRIVWVHGDAGMGKSALLRQFAIVVRDLTFHEATEPVYLLHLYGWSCTRPEELEHAICEKATRLYGLETPPTSIAELARHLERRAGTHVWILDDLTYLGIRPDSTQEAATIVQKIADLARTSAQTLQLVISTRRPPPQHLKHWESIKVEALGFNEAMRLAREVREQAAQPIAEEDIFFGAAQLFRYVGSSTALYKRALLLAVENQISYQAYAAGLAQSGSLDALEAHELSEPMVTYEVQQLEKLEKHHGFDYRAFLRIYYPLVAKASFFTQRELMEWFGAQFHMRESRVPMIETAYRNGLTYLGRLGFLLVEKRTSSGAWSMPPNQRLAMQALSDSEAPLPDTVPLRGVQQRLSLALERTRMGELEALSDLLAMEQDYRPYITDPDASAAVLHVMLIRAEIAQLFDKTDEALTIFNNAVELYETHYQDYASDETSASSAISAVLVNKGVRLGALGRSEDAVAVYDEVVARFGIREEVALAEQVARALVNKGGTLGALGRSEDAVAVYNEVGWRGLRHGRK
jgi:tetratricopeptide (TPR) repeat protein